MGYRRFVDADGGRWEIRPEASGEWRFTPAGGGAGPARRGRPPLYATDPFELSERELRNILADAKPVAAPRGPSPFGDDARPSSKRSPFLDDRDQPEGGSGRRSPFLDDR